MIVQRTGKFTRKEAISLGRNSTNVSNLIYNDEQLFKVWVPLTEKTGFRFYSSDVVRRLGKPLVTLPPFESSPGIWVLDDEETGIIFLIWSDGWKKNPRKGTSYEVICNDDNKKFIAPAFQRMVEFLIK